jgi:hypothetical protein
MCVWGQLSQSTQSTRRERIGKQVEDEREQEDEKESAQHAGLEEEWE